MKILIQQKKHQLYLADAGKWTPDPSRALQFPTSLAALQFCTLHAMTDVAVLLKFSSSRFDVTLEPFYPGASEMAEKSTHVTQ